MRQGVSATAGFVQARHQPNRKNIVKKHKAGQMTSVIVSLVTLGSLAGIAAGVFGRRLLSRREASVDEFPKENESGQGLMEYLVSHNSQGF
jgi:hypothetical protein